MSDEETAETFQDQLLKLEHIALIAGLNLAAEWIRDHSGHAVVFVEDSDGYPERMLDWVAKERNLQPIACAACGRPATEVDYLHPYHQEYDRCAACVNKK